MPTKTLLKNFFISMAPLYYSVWKSKFYGAFVLNRRVVLHAIDATLARYVLFTARPSHRRATLLDGVHPTRRLISTQVLFYDGRGCGGVVPLVRPRLLRLGGAGGFLPLSRRLGHGTRVVPHVPVLERPLLQPHKVVHPLAAVVCVLRRGARRLLRRVVLCFFCLEPEPGCAIGWSRPIPDEPDVAYPKCCARKTSVKKPIPPPKSLGEFGRRLVAPGLLAWFLNCFWHPFPPFRMAQFALGMVIGQGCLSVELNAAERKKVGRGADAIFFIFMVPELCGNQTVSRAGVASRHMKF